MSSLKNRTHKQQMRGRHSKMLPNTEGPFVADNVNGCPQQSFEHARSIFQRRGDHSGTIRTQTSHAYDASLDINVLKLADDLSAVSPNINTSSCRHRTCLGKTWYLVLLKFAQPLKLHHLLSGSCASRTVKNQGCPLLGMEHNRYPPESHLV